MFSCRDLLVAPGLEAEQLERLAQRGRQRRAHCAARELMSHHHEPLGLTRHAMPSAAPRRRRRRAPVDQQSPQHNGDSLGRPPDHAGRSQRAAPALWRDLGINCPAQLAGEYDPYRRTPLCPRRR